MKDQSGPAFPVNIGDSSGMTLRQYFAGQAMAGLVGYGQAKDIAKTAVKYADALLAELGRE